MSRAELALAVAITSSGLRREPMTGSGRGIGNVKVDTLEAGVWDEAAAEGILQSLKEVLESPSRGGDPFSGAGNVRKRRRGYAFQTEGLVEGKSVYVASSPLTDRIPALTLQMHLSRFKTWNEAKEFLRRLCGHWFDQFMLAQVRRLDLCAETKTPFHTLFENLDCPKTRIFREWGSRIGRRSMYFGAGKFKIRLYQKEMAGMTSLVTRIEAEYRGEKVPIRSLSELPRVKDMNPFSCLQFRNDADEMQIVKEPPSESLLRLWAFLHLRKRFGAQQARRILNKDRNFDRNLAPYLGTLDNRVISRAWEESKSRFFGANLDFQLIESENGNDK